jgi:hypothetical protein
VRRFLSFLLFCIISWQLIGFVGYFEFSKFKIKKELKSLIKRGVPQKQLIAFQFNQKEINDLVWHKKHEFELNGHLYDIVYKGISKKGIHYFKCVSDDQETQLFKDLKQYVSSNLGDEKNSQSLSKFFKLVQVPFVLNEVTFILKKPSSIILKKDYFTYKYQLVTTNSSVDTPPPNSFLIS